MFIYVNISDRQTDKHIKTIVRNLTKHMCVCDFCPTHLYNQCRPYQWPWARKPCHGRPHSAWQRSTPTRHASSRRQCSRKSRRSRRRGPRPWRRSCTSRPSGRAPFARSGAGWADWRPTPRRRSSWVERAAFWGWCAAAARGCGRSTTWRRRHSPSSGWKVLAADAQTWVATAKQKLVDNCMVHISGVNGWCISFKISNVYISRRKISTGPFLCIKLIIQLLLRKCWIYKAVLLIIRACFLVSTNFWIVQISRGKFWWVSCPRFCRVTLFTFAHKLS